MPAGIVSISHRAAITLALTFAPFTALPGANPLEPATLAETRVLEACQNVGSSVVDVSSLGEEGVVHGRFLAHLIADPRPGRVWIKGAVVTDEVDLAVAVVERDVRLEACRFKAAIKAQGATFKRGLSFEGSTFSAPVELNSASVALVLSLERAVVNERLLLKAVQCGMLNAANLRSNGDAEFDGVSVQGTACVDGAQFSQRVSFGYARVREQLSLTWATFGGHANFYGMEVGGCLVLGEEGAGGGATFKGGATFGDSRIGRDLKGSSVTFGPARFDGIQITGSCKFDHAEFGGPVNFNLAKVGGDFDANGARFLHTGLESGDDGIRFDEMRVGGSCTFNEGVVFRGVTSFILADIGGNFEARGALFEHQMRPEDIDQLSQGKLHHSADFGSLRVGGFALLKGAVFRGVVSLRNAQVGNLHIEEVTWPEGRTSVRLDGLAYRHIRASDADAAARPLTWVDQSVSWPGLRSLVSEHAEFSAQVFQDLEGYFKRLGYSDIADEVFLERKRIERSREFGASWPDRAANWFLLLLVGNGRHPEYALGWSLVIILIGCVVFRRSNMQLRDPSGNASRDVLTPRCSPFWYSLDLFVPIFDLKANDLWTPKPGRFLFCYTAAHKLVGAILVPLGLAAISGLVR